MDYTLVINCPKCKDSSLVITAHTEEITCEKCNKKYNIRFHTISHSTFKTHQYTISLDEIET